MSNKPNITIITCDFPARCKKRHESNLTYWKWTEMLAIYTGLSQNIFEPTQYFIKESLASI